MALVSLTSGAWDRPDGLDRAATSAMPDETAFDVLRAARSCRGTGLDCIDSHLDCGVLGPSELVVLHGQTGTAKSAVLRNIVVSYIASAELGGLALPAVMIDTEGTFDVLLLARLITTAANRKQLPSPADQVQEALSRLLVLRAAEPVDLLRQLCQLRDVLVANPTTSLLVVDSMSAWQPMATAFPRAVGPVLREAWKALARLQRQHCLAVVVANRDDGNSTALGFSSKTNAANNASIPTSSCCHLNISRHDTEAARERTSFSTCKRAQGTSRNHQVPFHLSESGEVICAM